MRWPWSRKVKVDERAQAAAQEAKEKLCDQKRRQPRVDAVAQSLIELGRSNHFAEAIEAAVRRPRP